jgi:hypothetical protein
VSTPLLSLFSARAASASDINQHMPRLRALASCCSVVVEFGTRSGNSTVAFLQGLADRTAGTLHSYDIAPQQFQPPELPESVAWQFHQADTTQLDTIPACDLLFIDTLHNFEVVEAELQHHRQVARWIAFHDTVLFGSRDELGYGPGINHAIFRFLAANHEWAVLEHHAHNCGLLVLQRRQP